MKNYEIEKSKIHVMQDVVRYAPGKISRTVLLSKLTGSVYVCALSRNGVISAAPVAFDTFIYIIEGKAGITIDKILSVMEAGQGMIIPAHRANSIKALHRFKMLIVVIKSGYEPAA